MVKIFDGSIIFYDSRGDTASAYTLHFNQYGAAALSFPLSASIEEGYGLSFLILLL